VSTAAYPVAAHWALSTGLVWLAASDLVAFTASGRAALALRAFVLAAASLFSSEAAWHLVALLPLLALLPPRAGGRRVRPLLLWPLFAAAAAVHFAVFEPAASGLVAAAPLERLRRALFDWPRFLEGALGGDVLAGSRPVAWAALLLAAIGVGSSSRRRFLALHALASPLPFAALGHNDRYAYLAYGVTALAFAACAPRGIVRLLGPAGRRILRRPAIRLRGAAAALVAALAATQAIQSAPRLESLRLAGEETAALLADLEPLAPKLRDPKQAVYVNCPASLKWALWDRSGIDRPVDFQGLEMVNVLCTKRAYFALAPLDWSRSDRRLVIACEGGRLLERPLDRPLGEREPLPYVFLAGGLEVATGAPGGGALALQRRFDELVRRTRELEDPIGRVLVEAPVEGLSPPLPREKLEWKLEPVQAPPGAKPPPGLFGLRLVARVDVERPAFLVAMTCLVAEDPLRRVTGEFGRSSALLEALLDGRPAPIVPAFVHACGIVVPAGEHQVVLRARGGKEFAPASER
jgi:hypothetical protein